MELSKIGDKLVAENETSLQASPMEEGPEKAYRSNLVIGFSLSATYFAAILYLLDKGEAIFAAIQALCGLLILALTYLQFYVPTKIGGRTALAVAIVPLVLSPFYLLPRLLLIYLVYRYGKACLSKDSDFAARFKIKELCRDAFGFLALLIVAIFLWLVNPAYVNKLGDLPWPGQAELIIGLVSLELIAMAFAGAARLRGGKITFAKVMAVLFSLLMCFLGLFLFIMMPAAIVMAEQMAKVPGNP